MIIQGDLSKGTSLTIGLRVSGISFDNASVLHCNTVEGAWFSFVKSLSADCTLKTRYSKFGSYRPALKTYYDTTNSQNTNEFSRSQRNARLCQINDSIEAKGIFRSESHLFISRSLGQVVGRLSSTNELETLLQAEAQAFHPIVEQARIAAQQSGGTCEIMTDRELFLEIDKPLNPAQCEDNDSREAALSRFDPTASICDCSLQSDMTASHEAECGFLLDGHAHAIILLKCMPSVTTSGQILQLTNLPIKELSITTITTPLDLEVEITDEEKRAQKLRRAASSSNKIRLHTSLAQSEERIDQLASGNASPCTFQMILHVWDKELTSLQQNKIPMLKSAITRFQGAKYYLVENPVLARDSFLSTLPGITVS